MAMMPLATRNLRFLSRPNAMWMSGTPRIVVGDFHSNPQPRNSTSAGLGAPQWGHSRDWDLSLVPSVVRDDLKGEFVRTQAARSARAVVWFRRATR
jgi:hypothetical protein